jgi:hypothetical protein
MVSRLLRVLALVVAPGLVPPYALGGPTPVQEGEDSFEQFQANLHQRIARHSYFKKIDLEWVWEYEDFVVLVQKLPKLEEGYVAKVAKLRSAESKVMNLAFRESLARELDLTLRPTSPRMAIVVLATAGDFDNYFQVMFGVGLPEMCAR